MKVTSKLNHFVPNKNRKQTVYKPKLNRSFGINHANMILTKSIQDGAQSSVVFLLPNEVINLKFIDHLSKENIRKFNQLRHTQRDKNNKDIERPVVKKKKQPKLSQRDIEELMGTHRDTYKRVGGAIRRR